MAATSFNYASAWVARPLGDCGAALGCVCTLGWLCGSLGIHPRWVGIGEVERLKADHKRNNLCFFSTEAIRRHWSHVLPPAKALAWFPFGFSLTLITLWMSPCPLISIPSSLTSTPVGIKPRPSAVKVWCLNHRTAREFPIDQYFCKTTTKIYCLKIEIKRTHTKYKPKLCFFKKV